MFNELKHSVRSMFLSAFHFTEMHLLKRQIGQIRRAVREAAKWPNEESIFLVEIMRIVNRLLLLSPDSDDPTTAFRSLTNVCDQNNLKNSKLRSSKETFFFEKVIEAWRIRDSASSNWKEEKDRQIRRMSRWCLAIIQVYQLVKSILESSV